MPLLDTKDFRHLTMREAKAQCKRLKVPCKEFGTTGDLLLVGVPGQGVVYYNANTGRFFCTSPKGKTFYSSDTLGRPSGWRKQLYRFFYVEI